MILSSQPGSLSAGAVPGTPTWSVSTGLFIVRILVILRLFQLYISVILSVLTIGKSASFVLTNENVEEIRRKDFKVSFGNELKKILLEAAENGDIQFIKEIFSTEVGLLDNQCGFFSLKF